MIQNHSFLIKSQDILQSYIGMCSLYFLIKGLLKEVHTSKYEEVELIYINGLLIYIFFIPV